MSLSVPDRRGGADSLAIVARRVLIDGRSGSGKTELARALVDAWPGSQLVRLDDLYPGWDGLDAGSLAVPSILTTASWRSWDWTAGVPGAQHRLDASAPIVIEGVGSISRASRALADVAVWVELGGAIRKRRALERDGDAYAPFWDRWAAQEERFIAREHPRELASMTVDGSVVDDGPINSRRIAEVLDAVRIVC